MKAIIVLEGKWLLSKQNSYLAARNGRRFKNPKYAAEMARMRAVIKKQLGMQDWKCTDKMCELKIFFYGPCMPCDFDNCGILTDAMQGEIINLGGKRWREGGLVVNDDKQFCPVLIDWKKHKERKIVIHLREEKKI